MFVGLRRGTVGVRREDSPRFAACDSEAGKKPEEALKIGTALQAKAGRVWFESTADIQKQTYTSLKSKTHPNDSTTKTAVVGQNRLSGTQ